MTVKALIFQWLGIVKMTLMPHTYRDYLNYSNHIIEYIGDMDMELLTSQNVQDMYFSMLDRYNPKTVLHAHTVFRIIVHYGIENDILLKDPLKGVKLPKKRKFSPTFLSAAELKRLLHCSEEYGIYNAVLLAGCAGLRRGECLALSVADIDTDRNVIHVSRSAEWKDGKRCFSSCKSTSSHRLLLVSDKFIESLMNHTDGEYFCDYSQSVLQRRLARCLKENNFSPMRFHDLRHTFASISVVNGDNLKVVQARLGHSSIQLTLDLYAHLDLSAQESSSSLFDDLII